AHRPDGMSERLLPLRSAASGVDNPEWNGRCRVAEGDDMSGSGEWMRSGGGTRTLPAEVDLTKPSIARVYDYVLGGKDNFAVDRAACEGFLRLVPEAKQIAI